MLVLVSLPIVSPIFDKKYFPSTYIVNNGNTTSITANVTGSGGNNTFQFISTESYVKYGINGVNLMKINNSGIYIKGDIYTNNNIDESLQGVYYFYLNSTKPVAYLNRTGDLTIKQDIFTNEGII